MDSARFHSEYEEIADQLFTFLVRSASDEDLAADILQEAAYRAFRSRHRFRGDSSFKTWIYRIAMNTLKNHWARKQREWKFKEEITGVENETKQNPEELVSGRERMGKLSHSLGLLQEKYRIPFILKHVDEMTYQEIAKVLDIEENAARVRVYRARQALQSLIREELV